MNLPAVGIGVVGLLALVLGIASTSPDFLIAGIAAIGGGGLLILSCGLWTDRPWAIARPLSDSIIAVALGVVAIPIIGNGIGSLLYPQDAALPPWLPVSILIGACGVVILLLALRRVLTVGSDGSPHDFARSGIVAVAGAALIVLSIGIGARQPVSTCLDVASVRWLECSPDKAASGPGSSAPSRRPPALACAALPWGSGHKNPGKRIFRRVLGRVGTFMD
jgi:hypothetical protein